VFENAEVLGFDLEWKAHATGSTGPRGKVATLQLSDGLGNVALFHLTSLRGVPPALASLLAKARLAGVGVGNDLKKLNQDYGVAIPPNVVELRTLATDVLRCAANKVGSLEAVFSQCCPGRVLNKKLCHHGGPRFVNWEKWPLEQHETMYALNDADFSFRSSCNSLPLCRRSYLKCQLTMLALGQRPLLRSINPSRTGYARVGMLMMTMTSMMLMRKLQPLMTTATTDAPLRHTRLLFRRLVGWLICGCVLEIPIGSSCRASSLPTTVPSCMLTASRSVWFTRPFRTRRALNLNGTL